MRRRVGREYEMRAGERQLRLYMTEEQVASRVSYVWSRPNVAHTGGYLFLRYYGQCGRARLTLSGVRSCAHLFGQELCAAGEAATGSHELAKR